METKKSRQYKGQAQSNYLYFGGLFGEEQSLITEEQSLIPTPKRKHKEASSYGNKWKEKREKERTSRENWALLYPTPKRNILHGKIK